MPKGIYKKTIDHKRKISLSMRGKRHPQTETTKRKISKANKGKHNSSKTEFKKGHKQSNTGKTHFKKGYKHTDKWKIVMSRKMKGNNNGFKKGQVSCWGREKYKNIWMKSSWEVKYARWLDKQNIKWLYEPKTFDLGNTTYTPDFKLKGRKYIEIKGWLSPEAYFKIKEFILGNPDIAYVIITERDLKKMGVLK